MADNTVSKTNRSEKRDSILAEAVRLFNDQGYYDTRLEDVAARVGTTKTSISYHFQSKEALLFEAYSGTCDFAEAELKLAAAAPNGLERVVRWVRAFAQGQSASILGERVPLAVISDPAGLGPEDEKSIRARLHSHAEALRGFLEEGVRDGSVRVSSPAAGVFFLLSLQYWTRRWLHNVLPTSHDAAIETICDVLRFGLCSDRTRRMQSARLEPPQGNEDLLFNRKARNRMKLEAFLRVGTRHFNRYGYRALSLSDVTAELGVSRGVFYYHFKDRDALLEGAANQTLDTMQEALTAGANAGGDGAEKLFTVLTSLFEGHLTDLNPLLRLSLFSSLSSAQKTLAMARFRRITAGLGELLGGGMADGSLRPVDIDASEHLLTGLVFAATRQRLGLFGVDSAPERNAPTSAAYFDPLFYGFSAAT